MKTYGEVNWEAIKAYVASRGWESESQWRHESEIVMASSEAGAQAVIEEFKRRHNIVIGPEED